MRRALLALVLTAAVLPCACSDPEDDPPEVPATAYCEDAASWDSADAAFEREVLERINEHRAEGADCEGGGEFLTPAEPLRMDPALRCAARKYTLALIAGDFFDPESPEGETYGDRTALAGYEGEALAQSIAAGQSDPAQVVATLIQNDENCANMMNPEATDIGVGYRPAAGVTYAHYWTLVFGRSD